MLCGHAYSKRCLMRVHPQRCPSCRAAYRINQGWLEKKRCACPNHHQAHAPMDDDTDNGNEEEDDDGGREGGRGVVRSGVGVQSVVYRGRWKWCATLTSRSPPR
jgi:predicted chitinase